MAQTVLDDGPVEKRLFISGISASLAKEELVRRLQTYGQLSRDLELNQKNSETTGNFAHCSLILDSSQWSRLRKLSGTVLKGSKLRIEEAKQHWLERQAIDARRPDPAVPNPRKRPPPNTTPATESKRVKRGEVIKDSEISQKSRRKGWIKGRYGRALAVLKREDEPPLKRNPDALSRLWGSAHPRPEQLTYRYDDEEEEWYDRRGRVIHESEITKKLQAVEIRGAGRVEIWESDEEGNAEVVTHENDDGQNLHGLSEPMTEIIDEEAITVQLAAERTLALDMLGSMFRDVDKEEAVAAEKKSKRNARDVLDIVTRFDPNAPESETESEEATEVPTDKGEPEKPLTEAVDAGETASSGSDEEYSLPAFLKQDKDNFVNSAGLTEIFKPSKGLDNQPFVLFQPDELVEQDDEEQVSDREVVETGDIHPDRLNMKDVPAVAEQEEANSNFIALAKDRGFQQSGSAVTKSGVFPLLFSFGEKSIWHGESSLFGPVIDSDEVKKRWEETRSEFTRDWKRKRREGLKNMRKAFARQSR